MLIANWYIDSYAPLSRQCTGRREAQSRVPVNKTTNLLVEQVNKTMDPIKGRCILDSVSVLT
jgi:hypothetical protein